MTSQRLLRAPLTIHTRDAELPHGAFHSLTKPGAFCREANTSPIPSAPPASAKQAKGRDSGGRTLLPPPSCRPRPPAQGPAPSGAPPQAPNPAPGRAPSSKTQRGEPGPAPLRPGTELRAGKGPGAEGLRGGSARPALTAAPPPPPPSQARARPAPPEVGRAAARGLLGAVVLAGPAGSCRRVGH